ncbi:hypothetical protein, partial, partial [Parasitella parasitica]
GSSSIGLLLDQEKAYDRVHPVYLRAVLLRFGFPAALVDCISFLFFDAHLVVNVSGFHSPRVPQLRGLKQGDPINPILFNLAFEPLLRKILQDPHLTGYQLPSPQALEAPSAVKMMAYADDIVCLLSSPYNLDRLQQHLQVYSAASNTSVNYHKMEAISLSGSSGIYGTTWCAALRSLCSVRYLGFFLYTSIAQRNVYLDKLLDKVRQGCLIHQQRGLSCPSPSSHLCNPSFRPSLTLGSFLASASTQRAHLGHKAAWACFIHNYSKVLYSCVGSSRFSASPLLKSCLSWLPLLKIT